MSDRTAHTVQARQARLEATKARCAARIVAAEEALKKAQERLKKAKADAKELIAKRTEELSKAEERHEQSEAREQAKARVTAKPVKAYGTVETETGEVRPLSREQAEVVKAVVGRSRKGTLRPVDGEDGQALLSALDSTGNVGETFEVSLAGRKTVLVFSVEDDGLAFETCMAINLVNNKAA